MTSHLASDNVREAHRQKLKVSSRDSHTSFEGTLRSIIFSVICRSTTDFCMNTSKLMHPCDAHLQSCENEWTTATCLERVREKQSNSPVKRILYNQGSGRQMVLTTVRHLGSDGSKLWVVKHDASWCQQNSKGWLPLFQVTF